MVDYREWQYEDDAVQGVQGVQDDGWDPISDFRKDRENCGQHRLWDSGRNDCGPHAEVSAKR